MKSFKKLAIDSMILIYLLEDESRHTGAIQNTLAASQNILISTLALAEVLTGFDKSEHTQAKLSFLSFVESYESLKVVGFGKNEALLFAQLRAKYPFLRAPDAIHLATAIRAGADAFFTNDKTLSKIEELPIKLLSSV